jgi:beta-phosphoglucomutase-like phosphatase (HAD superfamily)
MQRPSLVIFDCDGVLVDSEMIANREFAKALTDIGIPTTVEQSMERYVGRSMKSCYEEIEAHLGRSLPPDFARHLDQSTFAAFERDLLAVSGIEAVLDALDAIKLPYCVASSGSYDKMQITLGKTGLLDRFSFEGKRRIFSSSEVARGKPFPDLFLYAAAQCETQAQHCVVIEDSVPGVQAGLAAGMHVLGHAAAAYAGAERRLSAAGATIFNGMPELLAKVQAWA